MMSTTTTQMAKNAAPLPYCIRRRRRSFVCSWASRAIRSARSCSFCSFREAMRPLTLTTNLKRIYGRAGPSGQLRSGVGESPCGVGHEQQRHQHGTCNAPLADRVDHEELEVGQIGAEAEADQRQEKATEPSRIARNPGGSQEQDVADDPEHGNVDAGDMRVAAVRHRRAAM